MKQPSHTENVSNLFDQVTVLVSVDFLDAKWLSCLRSVALQREYGWKRDLETYLRGLCSAKRISTHQFDELCKAIEPCIGAKLSCSDFLWPLVWTVCVAASAVAWRADGTDIWFVVIALGLTSATSIAWAQQREWFPCPGRSSISRRTRLVGFCFFAMVGSYVAYSVPALVGEFAQDYSIYNFKSDRAEFAIDPKGFPMIREFARENFHVDVVLSSAEIGWSVTALKLPGSSVASMTTLQGYCELNMNRDNLLQSFGPSNSANTAMWVQGVMMHELGHCLDISRDLTGFGKSIHVYAIAPKDAPGVTAYRYTHLF